MAGLLEKIAAEVSPDLGGVDWNALEAQFRLPREEIVYATEGLVSDAGVFKYQEYMDAAFDRANSALEGIPLTWQIEENPDTSESEVALAMEAWANVQEETISIGDNVLHALRANLSFLNSESVFVVEKELLRATVSSTYMVCLFGLVTHAKAMMQLSGVAPEDIIASADNITKTFNALADLAEMGALDPLKPGAPAATGAVPVGVVIAISAVLAVGIIAWCVVSVTQQIETNRAIKLLCEEAIRSGDEAGRERCAELVKLNITATQGGPIERLAISLGQAALMVAISYGIFLMVPPIARMLGAKKASTT